MTAMTRKLVRTRVRDERGVALFLTLILVSTLSVLTVSLMFLSQSESFASGNYRLMTQARYGAEAGVQKAADYILNTDFATAAPNLVALLPTQASPVKFGGNDVVLSSDPAHPANFPDAAVKAAFQAATAGQLVAGNSTISYTSYATLVSLSKITDGYTGVDRLVQTWQITSDATIAGIRRSTVEVSAIIDSAKVPTISYGAFGTNPGCGSLNFSGHVKTNSYDSSTVTGSTAPMEFDTGGDVGTNGNMSINGSCRYQRQPVNATNRRWQLHDGQRHGVLGLLCDLCTGLDSSPAATRPAADAADAADIAPRIAEPSVSANTCAAIGLTAANCSVSGGVMTLKNTTSTPLTLPFIDVGTLVLTASSDPSDRQFVQLRRHQRCRTAI